MSQKVLIICLLCLLFFSQSLMASKGPIGKLDPFSINLKITSLGGGDTFYYSPILSSSIRLALWRNFSLGLEGAHQELGVQSLALYLQRRLSQPLDKDIWTSFQVGLSHLSYLDRLDEYQGLFFGAAFTRYFGEQWSAHTNLQLSFFPGLLIPSYEVGFRYYFSSLWSLDFTYKGYDLKRQGLTIGTTLYF